jgi:hypothetical protein
MVLTTARPWARFWTSLRAVARTASRYDANALQPQQRLPNSTFARAHPRRDLPLLAKRFACLGRSCAQALAVVFALVWRDSNLIFLHLLLQIAEVHLGGHLLQTTKQAWTNIQIAE